MSDISRIAAAIVAARRRAGLTQRQLAQRLGTSQPAVARLERGAANPTLDTLRRCAAATACALSVEFVPVAPADPVVETYKRDVDRTLLRENLRKSVDERLRSLAQWQQSGRELERAARAARAAREERKPRRPARKGRRR